MITERDIEHRNHLRRKNHEISELESKLSILKSGQATLPKDSSPKQRTLNTGALQEENLQVF